MRKEVWKVSVRRALFPSLEKSVERASGESPAHSIDVALYTQHAVIKLYLRLDASLYQALTCLSALTYGIGCYWATLSHTLETSRGVRESPLLRKIEIGCQVKCLSRLSQERLSV